MRNRSFSFKRSHYRVLNKCWLALTILGCAIVLSGCYPEPSGANETDIEILGGVVTEITSDVVSEDTSISDVMTEHVMQADIQTYITNLSTADVPLPSNAVICYDGTTSMMGFADILGQNEYLNTLKLIDSSVSACFSNIDIDKLYYRLGSQKPDPLTGQEATLTQTLSFYNNTDMQTLPKQVVLADQTGIQRGTRMNEPIQGFYKSTGLSQMPDSTETATPVCDAVGFVNEDNFVVVISDLEELQINQALFKALHEKVYSHNLIMSITAITSKYSGLVPLWSKGDLIWFEWGALPTGSCDTMLDYINYKIGVTIDPSTRRTADRTFYVLSIGQSDCVNALCASLSQQLTSIGVDYSMAIFDADITPQNKDVTERLTMNDFVTSKAGINRSTTQPEGDALITIQLQGTSNVNTDSDRWIEAPMIFKPRLSDARLARFKPEDFSVRVTLTGLSSDADTSPSRVSGEITSEVTTENFVNGDTLVTVRNYFPKERLEKGNYLVKVELLLNTPTHAPMPEWIGKYDQSFDNESVLGLINKTIPFDGSRTIGLVSLASVIMDYQSKTSSTLSLGDYSYEVRVQTP